MDLNLEKIDIKTLYLSELEEQLLEMGEKKFRAKQIFKWLHVFYVESFDEMTDISKKLREKLEEKFIIGTVKKEKALISQIDGTRKYIFRVAGGSVIESVFMKYHHGNSVCISTQSGCRMGCKFCASTLNGLDRNLLASELLDQIYQIEKDTDEKVSNVVLMGSGEPLDNYDNVIRFIDLISDENGKNMSQRNITLSTCGLVPRIYDLAKKKYQITLAISLHASDNETRKELMPIANRYSIEEIIEACKYYYSMNKRRITFEYSLVASVNDSKNEAKKLAGLVKGLNCHINLIPVNPIKERDFVQSNKEAVNNFKAMLERNGVNATVRREMGRDINGACGQLRNETMNQE